MSLSPQVIETDPVEKKGLYVGKFHLGMLSIILLISGFCSLMYQVVWIREFRVIFGGTTGAMAAVLSVFMGGLGAGSVWLGRKVEASPKPLRFYAYVEIAIAITAALTPFLIFAVKKLYFMTGGETSLGYPLATFLRILMTLFVIGLPCFFMGGTLPAVVKYVQNDHDSERKRAGWFYGINIAGALTGVILSTFFLLEFLGAQKSLWLAAALNLGIALLTFLLAFWERKVPAAEMNEVEESPADLEEAKRIGGSPVPVSMSYLAAFVTGFVFFVLELVWYRMSVPLTGGSVYSMGMVLVVALLGMALGGLVYSLIGGLVGRRASVFAILSALQCGVVILPYVAGDWFAWVMAAGFKMIENAHFGYLCGYWFFVVSCLVLPGAILSGIQFPMVLSFLGKGGRNIGSQIGSAYAWNTFGAILGSLLGGFLFIPEYGAEFTWLLCAIVSGGLAIIFTLVSSGIEGSLLRKNFLRLSTYGILALVAGLVSLSPGPEAFWRFSGIGYGRVETVPFGIANCREFFNTYKASIASSQDGREASQAVAINTSPSILTNGKSDSSIHGDVGTLVGLGVLPVLLHGEEVESVAVIGMGTGVTTGWLAELPQLKQLDVLEIEQAVVDAQPWFSDANFDYLENPKTRLLLGDARETLATRGDSYDLIISEPSNLTRTGACDFYTQDYYVQCSRRLKENGIFAQWIQAYGINSSALFLAAKTLRVEFPYVEMWEVMEGDIILLGSHAPLSYTTDSVRKHLEEPIMKKALARGFMTDSAEGVFARFLATSATVEELAAGITDVNTTDRNILEFRVARLSSRVADSSISNLMPKLRSLIVWDEWEGEPLNRQLLVEEIAVMRDPLIVSNLEVPDWMRYALEQYYKGSSIDLLRYWKETPASLRGKYFMAISSAYSSTSANKQIDEIKDEFPVDAAILTAINYFAQDDFEAAMDSLEVAVETWRKERYLSDETATVLYSGLGKTISFMDGEQIRRLFNLFEEPLPSGPLEFKRRQLLFLLSRFLDDDFKRRAFAQWGEGNPPLSSMVYVKAQMDDAEAMSAYEQYIRDGGVVLWESVSPKEAGSGGYLK